MSVKSVAPGSTAPALPPDANDFSQVFRHFAPRVSRWVKRLGGPEVDAEDLTQEVFAVVLRRLKDFDPERAELGAWLYGITVKVVQATRRRRRMRQFLSKMFGAHGTVEPASHEPDPEAQAARGQARSLLYQLLDTLPETHRTAFILYEVEELDGPAIAELTGTSVANVWVRVHRARRMLEAAAQGREQA